jgi:hypothetical protein
MNRIFLLFLIIVNITACGSDNDSQNNIDLEGSWKRESMTFHNLVADHTWTFSSDGTFAINNIIYHENEEGIVAPAFEGTFSLGSSINTPSGQTAIALNLIYNTPKDSAYDIEDDIYTVPGSDAPPVYEIAYIQDNNLYFGIRDPRTTEECSDLYLMSDDASQSEYTSTYIGTENLLGMPDRSSCHIRPTELDFENTLYKVE